MRRLSVVVALLMLLLPHTGSAASADETSSSPGSFKAPEVAELDAALGRLAEAIRYKVDQDLDTIGYAFWAVHDIDRARLPADIAGAPLAALQAWLSWMRTIDSFEKVVDAGGWSALGDEVLADATSGTAWLSAAVKLMHFRSLRKAGEDLARGLYGPPYADSIRLMYDEARRQRSEDAFAAVVKDYLRGQRDTRLLAVVPPDTARERAATGVVTGSNAVVASIEEAINRSRGRLLDVAPGERAAEFAFAASNFDDLTQLIKRSTFQNLPIRQAEDDRPAPWLGSIHGLRQVQIGLLNRYAASLRRQQVEVAFSAATSATSGFIEMSLKLGSTEPHAVMTVIDLAELGAGAANWSHEVDVRELLSEVPQSMVWALATELEVLWHIADRALGGIDAGIAEMVTAHGELVELAEANCREGFTEILAGQTACGVGLSNDGRLEIERAAITDVLMPYNEPAKKLWLSPSSPTGRYAVVSLGEGLDFIVDKERKEAQSIFAGRYGPGPWVAWANNESHVILSSRNEGRHWLYFFSLPDIDKSVLPQFSDSFDLIFDVESFQWIGDQHFMISLSECKEMYCARTELPRDYTNGTFELADGEVIVRSIEDLSKVPVELARMIVPTTDGEAMADADDGIIDTADQVRITMDDGTVLVGKVEEASLPFSSAFGSLPVQAHEIAEFAEETLRLADGSVLKGRFSDGAVPIETSRGVFQVPADRIVALSRADAEAPTAGRSPGQQLAPGRGLLTGQVLDSPFGQTVPGAKLRIVGSALEATADAQGKFELPYAPGTFKVSVSRDGYQTGEFSFSLQEATVFPVADVNIFRHPVGDGLFFRGEGEWVRINRCQVGVMNRNGTQKITGQPSILSYQDNIRFVMRNKNEYVPTAFAFEHPSFHMLLEGEVIHWQRQLSGVVRTYTYGQVPNIHAAFERGYTYLIRHPDCFIFAFR